MSSNRYVPRLSKSRYMAGKQCHLRLWNECFAGHRTFKQRLGPPEPRHPRHHPAITPSTDLFPSQPAGHFADRNHVLQVRIYVADIDHWGQINEAYS